jgi:hypothetical protein
MFLPSTYVAEPPRFPLSPAPLPQGERGVRKTAGVGFLLPPFQDRDVRVITGDGILPLPLRERAGERGINQPLKL